MQVRFVDWECGGYQYSVSNLGEVVRRARRDARGHLQPEITMKTRGPGSRYDAFCIYMPDGSRKFVPVHRLVAELFCDRPAGATCVNHIDGNKQNNRADNLEWVTKTEDVRHARRTGLKVTKCGPEEVAMVLRLYNDGLQFPAIGKAVGISKTMARNIVIGRNHQHITGGVSKQRPERRYSGGPEALMAYNMMLAGATRRDAARATGLSYNTVCAIARRDTWHFAAGIMPEGGAPPKQSTWANRSGYRKVY